MDNQNKPLKQYHKVSDGISLHKGAGVKNINSTSIPLPELVALFRSFYRDSYLSLFDMVVKQQWLEQKLSFSGSRRARRCGNGHGVEMAYSYFMTGIVGVSQKFLTHNKLLFYVVDYFKDFFPNFSDHDPFKEPEYFKYPYKHVTIDFLYVVRECHNRKELLDYAEEKKMTIQSFIDWALNWVVSYNIEKGEEIYEVIRDRNFFVYFKKVK